MRYLMVLFSVVLLFAGCAGGGRSTHLRMPGLVQVFTSSSGVSVANNIPDVVLRIEKDGFRFHGTVKTDLMTGETFFVPADLVYDQQEMVVRVVGIITDSTGTHSVGLESRPYSFQPGRQKIYRWDVNYLRKGGIQ